MKSLSVAILMKAIMQCFPVILSIMPDKEVLTFDFLDKLLKCVHSVEQWHCLLYCRLWF